MEGWAIGQCGVHVANLLAVLSSSHVECSVQGHHALDINLLDISGNSQSQEERNVRNRVNAHNTKLYQRTPKVQKNACFG